MKRLIKFLAWLVLWSLLLLELTFLMYVYYLGHYTDEAKRARTYEIYGKVVAVSGFADEKIPLHDEIAFILGHELAHNILRHTKFTRFWTDKERVKAEAAADKLGAFLMMRAGYDICVGREVWKKKLTTTGNHLAGSHPNYSYRYDELNVNCE